MQSVNSDPNQRCCGIDMSCKSCESRNQREFNGETAIHFLGLKGLEKPIVWVFPSPLVCLDCGFTEFAVPERELRVLVTGTVVEGAVVLDERGQSAKSSRAS